MYEEILQDKTLQAEAELLKKKYKISVRPSGKEEKENKTVKLKLTDKFNYVIHVSFTLDRYGYITDYSCDYGEQCADSFCCHCLLGYEYLVNECQMKMFALPSETEDMSEIEAMLSATDILWNEVSSANTDTDTALTNTVIQEDTDFHAEQNTVINETEQDIAAEVTEVYSTQKVSVTDCQDSCIVQEETVKEYRQMEILLGKNEQEEEIYLLPNNTDCVLNNNIGIIGTMGTGKTQFTKSLITQLYRSQKNNYDGTPLGILIFDYKGDYNLSKKDFVSVTDANVMRPYRIRYNPFSLNQRKQDIPLMPLHIANTFTDTISRIYNLGSKQTSILLESIIEAYRQQGIFPENDRTWNRPAPTFEQVYQIYEESNTGNVRDSLSAVMSKLHNFVIFEPDPLKTVSLTGLLKGTVVIDLSGYDEDIQSLIVAITLDQFYSQMQAGGSSQTNGRYRQLKTFIFVDEADNFMKMGFPSLRKILKEGREFGVGVILSTQSLNHFYSSNDNYSKYMNTWVIHNVSDLNRRDVEFVLKQPQKSEELETLYMSIKGLKKHESIVKISNDKPIMMKDKAFWQLYNEILGRNGR